MGIEMLVNGIIENSVSDDWDHAKREWKLANIYESDEMLSCLCGHYPIREICELRNTKNESQLIVGNCCVNKFLDINSDKMFTALKKVIRDIESSFNVEVIDLAYERNLINGWDRDFYVNTWRKRQLSPKQRTQKVRINKQILNGL